jgi:hypothetical protein
MPAQAGHIFLKEVAAQEVAAQEVVAAATDMFCSVFILFLMGSCTSNKSNEKHFNFYKIR